MLKINLEGVCIFLTHGSLCKNYLCMTFWINVFVTFSKKFIEIHKIKY